MGRESNATVFAIVVGVIALIAAYIGSYFVLVERRLEGPGWHKLENVAAYGQIDCAVVRALYLPVHVIDRRVRTEFWRQIEHLPTPPLVGVVS